MFVFSTRRSDGKAVPLIFGSSKQDMRDFLTLCAALPRRNAASRVKHHPLGVISCEVSL